MKVVRLTNFEQVQEYGTGWDDLLGMSKDNYVFLTLEWLAAWWKHFGAKRELVLLAVEDNGKILALAPLVDSTYRVFRTNLRIIEFIGSPASDYHSFILVGENASSTRMILDHIKQQPWDCIELKNIPEDSETAKEMKANSQKSLALKEKGMDICSFIPLPNTFDGYLQSLRSAVGGRRVRKLLQRQRKLYRKYKIEYKSYSQMDITLEEAMKTFFKLHQLRWQSRGSEGKFADSAFSEFHMDIARSFEKRGWLRLGFLTVDGEPTSSEYCFEYGHKMYGYLSGFDPYYSKYGVGTISLLRCIEDSIKRGLGEFDMLRGEHSYKQSWGSFDRRNIEFSAVRWKPVPKAYEWLVKRRIMPFLSDRLRKRASVRKAHG